MTRTDKIWWEGTSVIAVTMAGRKYIRIVLLCKIQRREIKIWDSLGDLIAKLTAIVEDSMELSVVNKVMFALFTVATLTGVRQKGCF